MRWIVFRQSWPLVAGAAGLSLVAMLAPQIAGGENRSPAARPAAAAPAAKPTSKPVAPRVAERIGLDPSIRETPALPAVHQEEGTTKGRVTAHLTDDELALIEAAYVPEPALTEPALPSAWPLPATLLTQLDNLAASDPIAADWADRAKTEISALASLPSLADPKAAESLNRLQALAGEADRLAQRGEDDDARSRILRASFAIVRRLAVWEPLHQVARQGSPGGKQAPLQLSSSQQILASAQSVQAEIAQGRDAAAWQKYLLLDQLLERCTAASEVSPDQRQLARDILYRYHSTQLSTEQAALLEKPTFRRFAQQLQGWGAEPVDLAALAASIERYETEQASQSAIAVAEQYDVLRWSQDDNTARLAGAVNAYYRNANVRVAISAQLVNRLLPKELRTAEPVLDMIQGTTVEGQSETSTRLRLVLLPDRFRWRLGLEANGEVASSTSSTAGPATFFQDGAAFYRARKLLTIDRKSIRLHQAEAEAAAQTQLNALHTDFDGIPLFSTFARAIARNQYEQKVPAARQEVEGKIMSRAAGTLDQQVARRIEKARNEIQTRLVYQLQKLQLDPTAVDMETTQERLIARYRLAGREQLSAHTPRPQAPGDSLLSVQIHETAFNNALDHLHLAGRKIELRELFTEMTTRFAGEGVPVPEDLPEGVFVTFAEHDPVRIDCQDGRLRVLIHLQELSLSQDRKSFKNLIVTGFYKPHSNQLEANLERDGGIFLAGNFLRPADRLFLAGVFDRILSRNRKLNLVNERISSSPELSDQQVTQFVIHDGWIGVALGPKLPRRTAVKTTIPQR